MKNVRLVFILAWLKHFNFAIHLRINSTAFFQNIAKNRIKFAIKKNYLFHLNGFELSVFGRLLAGLSNLGAEN